MNAKVVLIISLLIIGFYLVFEHRVHIFGNFQYVFFVLFILMHVFMHTGHGGHGREKKGGHH